MVGVITALLGILRALRRWAPRGGCEPLKHTATSWAQSVVTRGPRPYKTHSLTPERRPTQRHPGLGPQGTWQRGAQAWGCRHLTKPPLLNGMPPFCNALRLDKSQDRWADRLGTTKHNAHKNTHAERNSSSRSVLGQVGQGFWAIGARCACHSVLHPAHQLCQSLCIPHMHARTARYLA